MKQVNVDIRLGEPRQEIFIPVYIGDKRMKDIHIVVKDGEYEIIEENDARTKLLSYGIMSNTENDILEFLKRNADTINNISECITKIDKRDKNKLKMLLQEII